MEPPSTLKINKTSSIWHDTGFNNTLKLLKFTTKMHENKREFHREIIISNEAHFHFGGYAEQNSIWS